MAEAERQALLQEAAHRGHNGHIPSSMAVASAASASAAAASAAGRGHQHRRRSHEVRSSHLGSYVNGEAVEAAVDTVDLLGKIFKFITRVRSYNLFMTSEPPKYSNLNSPNLLL